MTEVSQQSIAAAIQSNEPQAAATSLEQSQSSEIPNPKFKTALCRNYINSTCNRNSGCHFAHGSEELRAVSENSGFFEEVEKSNTDYLNKWPSNIPTNFGTCKYDQNCNFAHGNQELREIPEDVQSQLKNSHGSQKHINNSAGQRNQQSMIMQQYMIEARFAQQYMLQMIIQQQQNYVRSFCSQLVADSKDEYVLKTVSDILKLNEELKIKQALQQIKKLCSRQDSTSQQKEILKKLESVLSQL